MLIFAGATGAKEEAIKQGTPQQGVELLFPAGTGKHAKGAKLSKKEKLADALLKKLKAIEKGGDANAVDKLGQTALMYAAAANNRLAVCWLVARRADATKKSQKGKTAAELTKDVSLRAFLEACCVDKRPLSDKEKKELQNAGFTKENTYGTENVDRDEAEKLKLATQLLRLGCKEENLHHFGYPSSNPLYTTLFSRHGYELNKAGEEMDWQKPDVLRLLLALGIKMGTGDALSQAKIAMLLDDAQTLSKIVEEHPDLATNRDSASKIIAYLGAPETLQVLVDAGLDPKLSWDYVYKNSKESFIQILLYGKRRSAAGIRALAAAGAPLPILSEHKNLLSRDLEDNEYDPEMVDALIETGVDVNAVGSGQETQRGTYSGVPPLIAAIRHGEKAVKQLLNKGAKVDSRMLAPGKEDDGQTALHFALKWGETSVARLLIEKGADVNSKDSSGKDVIHQAVFGCYDTPEIGEKGEADLLFVVERLLKAGAEVPKDILLSQVGPRGMSRAGREKLALLLLDAGADPLAKSKGGWTTLMYNGIMGPKIAQRLLDAGVDPTVKCREVSAMSLAVADGSVEVVKLLKEKGIDPGEGELWVESPEATKALLELGARIPEDMTNRLMSDFKWVGHSKYPAKSCEDYVRIIQILKQHGYKSDLMAWAKKDHSDESCVETEADFFRAFFKTGENPNETDENGNSLLANFASSNFTFSTESERRIAAVLPAFIEAGVDVNKPINQDGQTPLFYAEHVELIDQLLRAGADARVRDAKGRTPLFPCFFSRSADAVRLLMQRGVRINSQDNEGNTALMMAVTKDDISGVQALLDAGADPNIKNKAGKTALQIAQENKHETSRNEIVQLLKEHGAKE